MSASKLVIALIAGVLLLLAPFPCFAQNYVELRAGTNGQGLSYRTVDYNYTSKNGWVFDAMYYGLPGSNEGYFGAGKQIKLGEKTTVTPLLYAVIAKENGEKGVGVGLMLNSQIKRISIVGTACHVVPFAGTIKPFTYLDTLDGSVSLNKRVEVGGSFGFFHANGGWSPKTGPVVKLKDKLGTTNFYVFVGPNSEFRVTRSFSF